MKPEEVSAIIVETIKEQGPQYFSLTQVAGMLTMELAAKIHEMPESTRGAITAALVVINSHILRETVTDAVAQVTIAKARGAEPVANVLGQRIYMPDHSFDVEVTFDPDALKWVAVCDAIGVATEADSLPEVQERFFEIAPEIIKENGLMRDRQNAVFTFVHHEAV